MLLRYLLTDKFRLIISVSQFLLLSQHILILLEITSYDVENYIEN